MPIDQAQRHQIEQDALTAAWEAEGLAACDDAIALQREAIEPASDDNSGVILGPDETGDNDLLSRIAAFLSDHDLQKEQS